MIRRDPLQHDHEHRNTIRRIHGRPELDLCPECSAPVVHHRDIGECGGRTVQECGRCSWNDFDAQQLAHVRTLADDPGFSEY